MQLIGKSNQGIWFLFCVIDTYSKYAQVLPVKKGITITNTKM